MIRPEKKAQALKNISFGLNGIKETLWYMRRYVEQYKTDPQIREVALDLVRHLDQKDFEGEVSQLFDFVQNNIRYVRDIHNVETVQTPLKTLEYSQGDCDDKVTLLAAMLQSLGHPTKFHAMGHGPNDIDHVFLEVYINNRWVALETTEPVNLGWLPPNIGMSIYG